MVLFWYIVHVTVVVTALHTRFDAGWSPLPLSLQTRSEGTVSLIATEHPSTETTTVRSPLLCSLLVLVTNLT